MPIKNSTTISIIGCGWLGLPLGRFLVDQDYHVKGSTTRAEKLSTIQSAGIEPYQIQVEKDLVGENIDAFFQSDIVIVNIPPGRRKPDVETAHPRQIELVVEKAIEKGVKKLLFISSTGVYGNTGRLVTEEEEPEPTRPSGRALKQVEEYLRAQSALEVTILRLAGLVGGDRKAGRFLAGRQNVKNGNAPVNMVHRDDCIQVIYRLIQQEKWGEVYNLSADEHPTKIAFYTAQAKKQGLEPPTFDESPEPKFKIISNQKVKEALGYELRHPDPMRFP